MTRKQERVSKRLEESNKGAGAEEIWSRQGASSLRILSGQLFSSVKVVRKHELRHIGSVLVL